MTAPEIRHPIPPPPGSPLWDEAHEEAKADAVLAASGLRLKVDRLRRDFCSPPESVAAVDALLALLAIILGGPAITTEAARLAAGLLQKAEECVVIVPIVCRAGRASHSFVRLEPSDRLLKLLLAVRALKIDELRILAHGSSPVGFGNATEEAGGAAVKAAPPDAAPTGPCGAALA